MQLDTALHTLINQDGYPRDRVIEAAFKIAGQMSTHPRLLSLLGTHEMPDLEHMSLGELVDELGLIKAQIKNLEDIEEYAKYRLKSSGQRAIEGVCYSATVGSDYMRTSISLDKVEKEDPKLFRQLVKYIKTTKVSGSVNVKARS